MIQKLASLLYLPPPNGYASAVPFLKNLQKYPPKHELLIYSEHDYGLPNMVKLKVSPEVIKTQHPRAIYPSKGQVDHRISNLVFLTGLQLAREKKFSHVIYLEADCRVGRACWDEVMFQEYFAFEKPQIVAGSLAFYNPASYSPLALKRWQDVVVKNTARNFPCPTYGWSGSSTRHPTCVFANGALSVLDMEWMQKFFKLESAFKEASDDLAPFDMQIGMKVWDLFAEQSYDYVGQLHSVFSGYGNLVNTEQDRVEWLRSGAIVGAHQIKSAVEL